MSSTAKRAKAPANNPRVLPTESPGQLLKRRPDPQKLLLLRLEGGVWTFRDPDKDLLYRCTVDPDGNELWSCKVILTEHEWISQVEAARLIGVTRQAIMNAIFFKRLSTIDCNEKRRVRRTEVLALEPKQPTNKFKA